MVELESEEVKTCKDMDGHLGRQTDRQLKLRWAG